MRRSHYHSVWTNRNMRILLPVFGGLIVMISCTVAFSGFTFFLMDSMELNNFFSLTALSVGAFSSGHICGRFRRKRGLSKGILCGAMMWLILSLFGITFGLGALSIKKLLLLAVFGAAGGAVGVNTKRPKKLMD